ncbi:hypothetical protein [Methanoculleus sp. 10]|uniref:hypothetical protein n=1 Tax=Methanoculleus sp. 10 TaxID=430615 RepID=UPI0025FB89B7|nr:hypothetical protein [Methanoculleus sp. 10]
MLSNVQVTGSDGAGNSFSKTTSSGGYVTITGKPGTWSFTASKSGYNFNSWSQSITAACEKHAYLTATVQDVTLTLYIHIHDGKTTSSGGSGSFVASKCSGDRIHRCRATVQDVTLSIHDHQSSGDRFRRWNVLTTSSMTITGKPGTWSFTASKSGYNFNSWSQSITAACEKHAYLTATVQDVTLTLYIHDGSTSGSLLPNVQVTGSDGAGNSFSKTTSSGGYRDDYRETRYLVVHRLEEWL